MRKSKLLCCLLAVSCLFLTQSQATVLDPQQDAIPVLIPQAPTIPAKSYLLIDALSGRVIAEKDASVVLPPASLTKMMTMYVISGALKAGQITLDEKVQISRNAWATGGSKMFIRDGQQVTVADLIQGIIVNSGNDACVAMAEHLAGNEPAFATMMNKEAQRLGMADTHFSDSTGLSEENHHTTAHDLAVLARALIHDYPEHYTWYGEKYFMFNGIRQPNRNRLLWRDATVDGIKTGHTEQAGYCLVASAKRDGMRLISVVLGAKNEDTRALASQRLLNYGFRFYETSQLYKAQQALSRIRVWQGVQKTIPVGLTRDLFVTIPRGQYKQLKLNINVPQYLKAPIEQGTQVGLIQVGLNDDIVAQEPLYALSQNPQGGLWVRSRDVVALRFKRWFGGS